MRLNTRYCMRLKREDFRPLREFVYKNESLRNGSGYEGIFAEDLAYGLRIFEIKAGSERVVSSV